MAMAALKRFINHSVPVTVVTSAYDTSGNGGRKLVRLSNGWLVCSAYNSSAKQIQLYKSADYGATWSNLCYINGGSFLLSGAFAIAAYNNYVSIIFTCMNSSTGLYSIFYNKIDVISQTNVNVFTGGSTPAYDRSALGSVSLCYDLLGNIHAAWAEKNAPYASSFNIRYAKSTNSGGTWTSFDGTKDADQLTIVNQTDAYCDSPCIISKNDNKPIIFYRFADTSSPLYRIQSRALAGSSWGSEKIVYNGGNFSQRSSSATVSPNGAIHVVWDGKDATDTTKYNIQYSKSIDLGVTWSAAIKLTNGNTYDQVFPSITADKNNNIYVEWSGADTTNATYQIKRIIYNGEVWGAITNLTASPNQMHPSLCANYKDFADPLCIYQDNAGVAGDVSLLHFNGADGSTVFTDENPSRIWTPHGGVKIDTAQSKFGGSSAYFDGSGYIDTPDSTDLLIPKNAFTIDFWVKRKTLGTDQFVFGQSDNTVAYHAIYLYFTTGNLIRAAIRKSNGEDISLATSYQLTDTTSFHHIALVLYNNVLTLYVDGVSRANASTGGTTFFDSSYKFAIGRYGEASGSSFNGWIDEFRFSTGIARWTTDFTPPTIEDTFSLGCANRIAFRGVWNE